ncbi:BON domain-containing protein [bacterium]|nr:BON domain-containing protein [bacterium]
MTSEKNPHDIAKAVKALLVNELHLDPAIYPVEVSSVDGSVLIEGVVDKISQKKRALLFAMGHEGVSGVIDRLRVRPSVHMSDDEIRDHVIRALSEESALKGLKIEPEVNGGVVDLEGEVWSLSHKRLAGALAWWVPGSTDVINSIEVVPAEADSDEEVSDAIRLILEKDRLVDASSLRVFTRDWVVTLEGVLASAESREAAEDDAWFTWGVNGVVNNVIIDAASIHKLP